MIFLIYLFLFLFGAAIGSFINVLTLRFDPEFGVFEKKIIGGRSHCVFCQSQLRWFELIPLLSWLWQGGKCRHCKRRLFRQYPIVEFLTGAIFAAIYFFFTNIGSLGGYYFVFVKFPYLIWSFVILWSLVFCCLIALSLIDLKHYIIPDIFNVLIFILGIAIAVVLVKFQIFGFYGGSFLGNYGELFGFRESILINRLIGFLVGGGFFALIIILTKGRAMGFGDVKLGAALGVLLGWPDILMALFLSFIIGSIVSLFLIYLNRKTIKDMVPFGPFLALGVLATFFFGFKIIDFYFKLFPL